MLITILRQYKNIYFITEQIFLKFANLIQPIIFHTVYSNWESNIVSYSAVLNHKVDNTKAIQNYWVFGLWTSSGFLKHRKHDI
jgi:hypothetical protein